MKPKAIVILYDGSAPSTTGIEALAKLVSTHCVCDIEKISISVYDNKAICETMLRETSKSSKCVENDVKHSLVYIKTLFENDIFPVFDRFEFMRNLFARYKTDDTRLDNAIEIIGKKSLNIVIAEARLQNISKEVVDSIRLIYKTCTT